MKNIIDIIYEFHTNNEAKEKFAFLKQFITIPPDFLDRETDVIKVIDFFEQNLPNHFSNEEIMISVLMKKTLSQEQQNSILKILKEHHELLKHFAELKKLTGQYKPDNFYIRNKIAEIFNTIVQKMIAHTELEDKELYPLAYRILNDEDLAKIEENIKRKTKNK